MKILLAEDDFVTRKFMTEFLSKYGECDVTVDGMEAVDAFMMALEDDEPYDLVCLDIMMPVMDGITAAAKIRQSSNIPLLFLTAKSEAADKILGLNIGADDYITKPFDPMELVARVRSHLRRYTTLGSMPKNEDVFRCGGILLDDKTKQVTVDGELITLTPIEFSMLRLFITHPGQVFSIRQIYENVWNETAIGSENAVAVHIRHLREKTEITPSEPRYIKVVWGLGYKMEGGQP